ncbi:hypothetical protein OS493_019303 [Desmophyllum pertusum]|uniref:Uncharacterized protein n=1 Tax=Desmophyllum pertusum TaxID=174260 RepID=A0A9X0A0L6_9CNID|nr:hypothetical protein OS493_019303 [Desmophyllum pertusum]
MRATSSQGLPMREASLQSIARGAIVLPFMSGAFEAPFSGRWRDGRSKDGQPCLCLKVPVFGGSQSPSLDPPKECVYSYKATFCGTRPTDLAKSEIFRRFQGEIQSVYRRGNSLHAKSSNSSKFNRMPRPLYVALLRLVYVLVFCAEKKFDQMRLISFQPVFEIGGYNLSKLELAICESDMDIKFFDSTSSSEPVSSVVPRHPVRHRIPAVPSRIPRTCPDFGKQQQKREECRRNAGRNHTASLEPQYEQFPTGVSSMYFKLQAKLPDSAWQTLLNLYSTWKEWDVRQAEDEILEAESKSKTAHRKSECSKECHSRKHGIVVDGITVTTSLSQACTCHACFGPDDTCLDCFMIKKLTLEDVRVSEMT